MDKQTDVCGRTVSDKEVDIVLKIVGGYRPYHVGIFLLLGISCYWPWCYQNVGIVFIGYTPPHHCKISGNQTLNESIPHTVENGEIVWDRCNMYTDFSLDNSTVPCTNGWTYYTDGYSSIVTKWDLVCDRDYVVEMILAIYQCCILVAVVAVSYIIDRYGRKPVHVISVLMVALLGSVTSLSNTLATFIVLKSVTSFFVVAGLISGLTLIMELFDSSKRAFAGIGLEIGWLTAFLPIGLIAWITPDWRHLQLALSIINLVWISYIWILEESVPWLVVTGRLQEANKVSNRMARWNRVKLDPPVQLDNEQTMEMIETSCQSKVTSGTVTVRDALQLMRNPVLRKHQLVSMALWLVNFLVYYEIVLVSPTLPGNRFFNMFLVGLVEVPAYLLAYVVVNKFGRRIPMSIFQIATGFPLFCVVFIPKQTASGVDLSGVILTVVLIAKFNITSSLAIMLLYTKELFPTSLRATSSGVSDVAGRIGAVVAPMMAYAAKTSLYWLPSIVCGIISVAVGLLLLVLPETKDKPLPQTVEDVTKYYKHNPQTDVT